MTCEEYREKCLNETIQKIEESIKKKKSQKNIEIGEKCVKHQKIWCYLPSS
jgi:REP element-mobilizing transposase RayT